MSGEAPPPVRIVVADELGQLKVAQAPDLAHLDALNVVLRWGSPNAAQSVECMAVDHSRGLTDTRSAAVAVGRADGSVSLLNPCTGLEYWRVPAQAPGDKAATLRGVHFLHSSPAAEPALPPHVLSCTHGGTARIHGWQGEVSADATELASWSVPANVCCTALDAARGLLAVGAQGTELRLFDVATGAAAFVGKGGRPNKVGLMDRPWNTAAAFMPGSNGTKLAVGTGEHKFRLYDTAAGKRPQLDIVFGQARVTAVAPEADGMRCWVANGLGQVEVYDFRAGRFAGAIKGIAGSVRSLALHPDRPVIASVGLDRFLRLHDTGSRRSLGKVYLKTLLTHVDFCPADVSMAAPVTEEKVGQKGSGKAAEQPKRRAKAGGSSREGAKKRKP